MTPLLRHPGPALTWAPEHQRHPAYDSELQPERHRFGVISGLGDSPRMVYACLRRPWRLMVRGQG